MQLQKTMCIALEIDVKTVIFTDSLSVIQTVFKLLYNLDTVNQIRDMLVSNAVFLKILWILVHTNIPGNEKSRSSNKKRKPCSYINGFTDKN